MKSEKEKNRAIKNYASLQKRKQAFNSKWGMRKVWPHGGALDAAFRTCARLECLKETQATLNK